MAAAPGALQKPGDAFGAADLQNPFHRSEVHAQIQTRRADDTPQPPLAERGFDPLADLSTERPMMQGDFTGELRTGFEQQLVPRLGLRSGIREDKRGPHRLQFPHDLPQQAGAQMTGPGEAVHGFGQQRIDDHFLRLVALDDEAAGDLWTQQHGEGFIEIADGGRQGPDAETRCPASQPGEGELRLYAALAAQLFVPFIHHDHVEMPKQILRVVPAQHDGKAFRGGDQGIRHAPPLLLAVGAGGVSGAGFHSPRQSEFVDRGAQGGEGVGGERPERRDPEHPQVVTGRGLQGREPRRVGFAGAGGGVNQPLAAGRVMLPNGALKGERLPLASGEPVIQGGLHKRNRAFTVSRVSASAAFLSVRQRAIRGNRTAIPDLCRVDR